MIKSPLFFVPMILIMIVPTIISSTVYAQITTPQSSNTTTNSNIQTRTYGPQTAANTTAAMNSTAAEGIKDMRILLDLLEPDIQRYDLVDTFNEIVMAFAYIQGNLTILQNQTNASITAAESTVGQLRAQITTLQDQLEAAQADLLEATVPEEEEDEAPEEEVEDEEDTDTDTETDDDTTSDPQSTLEDLVENDGPRTDPEGDGGFPGDIDG